MIQSAFDLSNAEIRSRVMTAADFDEALDILAEITLDMGFTQALYGYIPTVPQLPNGDWLPLRLNVRNFPPGWLEGWEPFMQVDPYYRACFGSTLPIDWGEVQADADLMPIQKRACGYLGDYGLSRGITVPVHLPFHRFAVMSAIADDHCRDWATVRSRARDPLFRLMHVFTKAIHDLGYEDQIDTVEPVRLTPRERECLRWASAGKTSSETAIIIGRSVETVRLHMKNAIRKLDATNRSQAVATAIHFGLI